MKKERKVYLKILIPILIFGLALVTTSCATFDGFMESIQDNEQEDNTIQIGIYEPMSGINEEAGKLEISGIELAHELYPTVLGKEVQLIYSDNKSKIDYAKDAAQKLADEKVAIALGSYGNALSIAGGETFRKAGIPAIGITCTNPLVTKGNPFYFRVCIVDSFQGVMAAKYVYNDLGQKKAVIMKALDDDYGAALSQRFSDKLASLTGKEGAIACTVEYPRGTVDFQKQLETIKNSGTNVVYLLSTAKEAALVVKQARDKGMDTIFLGTDLWDDDILIKEGKQAAEGLVFTTYSDMESTLTEKTNEFLSAYHKKFGKEKKPESAVALGFDAYLLAIDTISKQAEAEKGNQNKDKPTLRDVLQKTKDFQGATGSITFDDNGDPIKPVVFITVKNGEFIYKYTAKPEWD
jgi:branched-chain amino acid transport system substrate-binding protein